jgi:Transposase DDE domain group 1
VKASSRRARRNPSHVVPEVTERFTGKVQTKYGGAGLLRRFVHKVGLPARLDKLAAGQSGLAQYLLCVLFGLLLGLQRQSEIAELRKDPAALLALGLAKMPSQPALSRFFACGTRQLGRKLLGINTEFVRKLREGRVGATLDLDGQVVVARGNPGGASFGYNPKRKGAKSYFIMMGFWGEVRDIVAAELFGGHRASVSAQMAKDTYRQSRQALPASVLRVRLRADCGFYSDEFLKCLEGDKVTYAVAARLTAPVKAMVVGLDYQSLDDKWGLAEFEYRGHGWKHSRRMVVVRERLDPENPHGKQLPLFECEGYAYQVIATNAPWAAVCVWHFYNDRSRLENIIKESQYDFGSNHIISKRVGGNATWLALSVLAYNATNWLREKVLGQRGHRHMAHWLRHHLIVIPATLVHSGRRYYLNIWRDHPSRPLFEQALCTLEALRL